MQYARIISVLAALCANLAVLPCFAQDAGPSPKETIEKWAKALMSRDPADALRFYAESEDLIVIISNGSQFKGYSAVKKDVHERSSRDLAFYESEVTELVAHSVADVAWGACRQRVRYRVFADDSKWQLEVQTTFVLKRHKDGWQIVLQHSSPIAGVPRIKAVQ
jgi:ketosteroid isomerase-like protein